MLDFGIGEASVKFDLAAMNVKMDLILVRIKYLWRSKINYFLFFMVTKGLIEPAWGRWGGGEVVNLQKIAS